MVYSEHEECKMFANYLKQIGCLYSKLAQEIWTPSFSQIKKQKAEGMNGGVPDYIIILRCRSGARKLIFIEMKKKKGGVVSDKQKLWINALLQAGIVAIICNGALEAIKSIQKIMVEN